MNSVLLMLLLPVIRAQRVPPSCPASCVVCSEDAVICQRLAHIIDAPDSTQALLLTEGSISAVPPASLSDLSNITVIGLSHNHISELSQGSFRNLPFLHVLLLDYNLLTNQALQGGALKNLTQLQVLALGHNFLSMVQADWFKGTTALQSLKLEGNLITSLDSGSFPQNDLRELQRLDLSDNLIHHVDTSTFIGMVSLKNLDLSRNRLSSAPAEAFSYLSWLTNLNLDLNSWNCSCQLLELAAFLSTFIQQPDKTLYNGRRMVCVSADNPAVTTVLELTDANCVPSNQNITVQIETRGSVTPQLYARDLAITAVICFSGGVGLTLLVVLIYCQVSRRKKRKERQRLKEEEEGGSSTVANHVSHLDVSERTKTIFLQNDSSQQWNKEAMTDGHGGSYRSRVDENGAAFRCPNCSSDRPRPNPVRRDLRMNGGIETEEDRERRRVRMMMEEDRRRQGNFNRDAPDKFHFRVNNNSSSNPPRDNNQRTENSSHHSSSRDTDNDMEVKSRGYDTLHCESCHRTYRPPEQHMRHGRTHTNPRDTALYDGFPSQHRLNDRGRNPHSHLDTTKSSELRRNVTFDLESPRTPEQGGTEAKSSRDKDKGRERRHKVQSSRLLKVKLNLNPLRKSKVHPKRKHEQGHSEKSSPKKSREKRREGRDRDREEKERKGKSDKKTKKSSKAEGSSGDGKNEKEEEDKGDGGRKPAEQKQDNQSDSTQPESSQPADQSAPAGVSGQGQSLQGVQYQGPGLVLGGAQLSSQHPFSLLAADRNRNLSLIGPAGSQLTGSNLSLQGGSFLSNAMPPGTNALFPSGPGSSLAPSLAFSGPGMVPSGAPDILSRQAAAGATPSVPSLHANTLQSSPAHAGLLQSTQAAGRPLNMPTNPAVNPAPVQSLSQSQQPPDSSPLLTRLKSDPAPGPGPSTHTVEGLHQPPSESQAPSTTENLPVQGHDGGSGVTPQTLQPVTTVENISNNNSQTDTVPGGPAVSVSAGTEALTAEPAVGGSGVSMQPAAVSVSGVSAQTGSPAGAAAAALLQQEYLSEEGGSSPRRKLKLVLPEKTSSRPPTALEKKIR